MHYAFYSAGDIGGGAGASPSNFFSRKKKGKKKLFKAGTIKRLSPRSKGYCFSHSRASTIQKFFLSDNRVGRQYFSVFHGPSLKLQL